MRREWSPEELVEAWTLLDDDRLLIGNNSGSTRLGFALLLKFFEIEARFPATIAEIPRPAVTFMADQVKVDGHEFGRYEWSVVEQWNSGNTVIFYGKDGDLTGADREHTEISMLALHLLQSALVHINTLLLQAVLETPQFHQLMDEPDRRALTPLFWSNIKPYGRSRLDMDRRLDLSASDSTAAR